VIREIRSSEVVGLLTRRFHAGTPLYMRRG
jgi:hypothetical protein